MVGSVLMLYTLAFVIKMRVFRYKSRSVIKYDEFI